MERDLSLIASTLQLVATGQCAEDTPIAAGAATTTSVVDTAATNAITTTTDTTTDTGAAAVAAVDTRPTIAEGEQNKEQ